MGPIVLSRSWLNRIMPKPSSRLKNITQLALETIHLLLLVGIVSCQHLNLLHWLPLLLGLSRAIYKHRRVAADGYEEIGNGQERPSEGKEIQDSECISRVEEWYVKRVSQWLQAR